jgi:hypothetical protein
MLMRTQAGALYESYSNDGTLWSAAQPTRFRTSTSPAALDRLPDGRIVLFFNHCEMPPRHEGAGVYGGRDALHAAISADEGKTWRGFREVYRDPFRNETPPRRGDRGTAYPLAAATKDGGIVLLSGQGNRRNMILVDPRWITQTRQSDDLSGGLEAWHAWKEFGPASGFWRDRTTGARLVDHPSLRGAKALLISRPDANEADCASWNFPATTRGKLTLRVMPREGFGGLHIGLNDRFFNPGDQRGESEAIFRMSIGPRGESVGETKVPLGQWSAVTLQWDLSKRECQVRLDEQPAGVLPLNQPSPYGISYLRLLSLADQVDAAGCLVESTAVEAF